MPENHEELRPLLPLDYQRPQPPTAQPQVLPVVGLALMVEAAIAIVFRLYYGTRPLGPILIFGLAISLIGVIAWRGYRWSRWFLAILLYFKAMILFGAAIALRQSNPLPLVALGVVQLIPAVMLLVIRRRG